MVTRDIFSEISQGFDALADERQGKATLKTYKGSAPKPVILSAQQILAMREKMKVSRGVLAIRLRVNERTLENWEQGRAKPNTQARLLLRMVEKFPDTFARLESL